MVFVPFTLRIDGRDLIGSGSVIVHEKEEIVFNLSDITFRIRFERTEDQKTHVDGQQGDPKELVLRFLNFTNSLGTAFSSDVGTIEGRVLRGSFFVHTLGEKDKESRLVNYMFSLGEAANG